MWPIQNDAKYLKMTETLANGYSSESTQRELSNEYLHDRVKMFFQNSLHPLDECSLSIGRVNPRTPGRLSESGNTLTQSSFRVPLKSSSGLKLLLTRT